QCGLFRTCDGKDWDCVAAFRAFLARVWLYRYNYCGGETWSVSFVRSGIGPVVYKHHHLYQRLDAASTVLGPQVLRGKACLSHEADPTPAVEPGLVHVVTAR